MSFYILKKPFQGRSSHTLPVAMFVFSPAGDAPRTPHRVLGGRKLCDLKLTLLEARSRASHERVRGQNPEPRHWLFSAEEEENDHRWQRQMCPARDTWQSMAHTPSLVRWLLRYQLSKRRSAAPRPPIAMHHCFYFLHFLPSLFSKYFNWWHQWQMLREARCLSEAIKFSQQTMPAIKCFKTEHHSHISK